ncbi:hypothetical protein [Paenibacillus sp. URB8-2]|uniref:hypothetical protein n=1 Tax=Paenibacillus sp. URB8-2 TaxID=2741301 RepID=UPI0015C0329A|nr:hypothetical protein [Paenibacillus sp. URB8-2]BCG56723.1 hypothetical protein PUR_01480 [Paenibacillus sp. URB8-2]
MIHPVIAEMLMEKDRLKLESLADGHWRRQEAENGRSRPMRRVTGALWSLAFKRMRRML